MLVAAAASRSAGSEIRRVCTGPVQLQTLHWLGWHSGGHGGRSGQNGQPALSIVHCLRCPAIARRGRCAVQGALGHDISCPCMFRHGRRRLCAADCSVARHWDSPLCHEPLTGECRRSRLRGVLSHYRTVPPHTTNVARGRVPGRSSLRFCFKTERHILVKAFQVASESSSGLSWGGFGCSDSSSRSRRILKSSNLS